jgi:CheY-like chemotaxis protein
MTATKKAPKTVIQDPETRSGTLSCCIVIVDDDAGHVRLTEKRLRRCGISNEIGVCHSGPEVLESVQELLRHNRPVIMLLDLNMPGMTGQQVLKLLKSRDDTKDIPVFVLTTSNDPAERQECLTLGCNDFMTKPIQFDQLAENIQRQGFALQIIDQRQHAAQ